MPLVLVVSTAWWSLRMICLSQALSPGLIWVHGNRIHVEVMDSYILLFRGGKPREVMEIWFTAPHCLFSSHINCNQNQKRPRLPSHVYCVFCVLFSLDSISPCLCEPWHFQHLPSCRCGAHACKGQNFLYKLHHSKKEKKSSVTDK